MSTRGLPRPMLFSPSVKLAMQAACAFVALVPALVDVLPSDDVASSLAHLFWCDPR